MSVPKSKILNSGKSRSINVSKGIMAMAKVKRDTNNCETTNNQNVNINIKATPDGESLIVNKDGVTTVVDSDDVIKVSYAAPDVVDRDALSDVTHVAENTGFDIAINKALSLIIDLLESNPLIVNKYIVPMESTFIELIQALTLADSVTIQYEDIDVSCCGFSANVYSLVDKIYITKNDETASLLYNYPDVIQLLDEHKISYQWIVKDT